MSLSGPFFAPGVDAFVEAEISKTRHAVSDVAQNRVDALLHDFLRHPTGYYQSRIATSRRLANTDVIHDHRVVYGPWLEGVGSRNRTTRFKGYHVFRIVSQGMQQRAVDLADIDAHRIAEALS